MLKKSPNLDVALISVPDKATAEYVCKVLKEKSATYGDVLVGGKGLNADSVPIHKSGLPIFIVVPSAAQGAKQVTLAKRFAENGGIVFVWGLECEAKKKAADDDWLLEMLLEQTGAVVSKSLGPICIAVQLLSQLGARSPIRVQIKGKSNALAMRLSGALNSLGLGARRKGEPSVAALVDGDGVTFTAANKKLPASDISTSIKALALLSQLGSKRVSLEDPEIGINVEEAYSIARPPARLLSETTSKRLISCFGISLPNERLCRSAAQASGFAASFEGAAVIKLSRPAFENKTSVGAVRFDVKGHAAVRREVASLELLGRSLGPPEPLGYLVSEQMETRQRVWVKMLDTKKLGRVLLLGPGDARTAAPTSALAVPATAARAADALKKAVPRLSNDSVSKLAVAVARLSRMAHRLAGRIDRLEIDPLVAVSTREDAIALDALVGVSGGQGNKIP